MVQGRGGGGHPVTSQWKTRVDSYGWGRHVENHTLHTHTPVHTRTRVRCRTHCSDTWVVVFSGTSNFLTYYLPFVSGGTVRGLAFKKFYLSFYRYKGRTINRTRLPPPSHRNSTPIFSFFPHRDAHVNPHNRLEGEFRSPKRLSTKDLGLPPSRGPCRWWLIYCPTSLRLVLSWWTDNVGRNG